MKKNIFKKIFIKFSKLLGFEIIDQSEFNSPTLNKELNEELSNIKKSIVLPLGEVKLTRKIQSLSIIFRTNTNIEIWDQNKKRIFEYPKIYKITPGSPAPVPRSIIDAFFFKINSDNCNESLICLSQATSSVEGPTKLCIWLLFVNFSM